MGQATCDCPLRPGKWCTWPDCTKRVTTGRARDFTSTNSSRGWRTIGGKRCYFKSKWEANYARFLQWRKATGEIIEWQYEPETFWFQDIKRGVRSYKPDFRTEWYAFSEEQIIERVQQGLFKGNGNDGNPVFCSYYEVKGYLDSKSRTKIKRFKKYYPDEILKVVGRQWFQMNESACRAIIPDWE